MLPSPWEYVRLSRELDERRARLRTLRERIDALYAEAVRAPDARRGPESGDRPAPAPEAAP